MSNTLLESEIKAAQVLDYGSQGWYFIVSGSSREDVLENEEKLAMRLTEEITKGNLGSFLGTHIFVPSIENQKKTYEAMKSLLPLAGAQFEYLGFPPEYKDAFCDEFAAAEIFCLPDDAPAQAGISRLFIGEVNGRYYSSLLPFHAKDESIFRSIAGEFEFVHFINKATDIGRDLDTLTRTILIAFLAAYLAVSIIVFIVYPLRDSFKICAVPVFLVVITLAMLALNKIPVSFFPMAAMVLVFGLGLDYIFYMITGVKKGEKGLTPLAVLLSFLTTLLSFGALILSGFMPVHMFGLTVTGGLAAAFISAMLLTTRDP
jgi:predicted exporter